MRAIGIRRERWRMGIVRKRRREIAGVSRHIRLLEVRMRQRRRSESWLAGSKSSCSDRFGFLGSSFGHRRLHWWRFCGRCLLGGGRRLCSGWCGTDLTCF